MTAEISVGDLRHRVVIERPVRSADGAGGFSITWESAATVWAAIWPRTASEQVSLDRVSGTATHDIWMRYRADVKPEMRITYGQRTFDIRGAIDVEERRRWLKCIVEERDL